MPRERRRREGGKLSKSTIVALFLLITESSSPLFVSVRSFYFFPDFSLYVYILWSSFSLLSFCSVLLNFCLPLFGSALGIRIILSCWRLQGAGRQGLSISPVALQWTPISIDKVEGSRNIVSSPGVLSSGQSFTQPHPCVKAAALPCQLCQSCFSCTHTLVWSLCDSTAEHVWMRSAAWLVRSSDYLVSSWDLLHTVHLPVYLS